ncbi:hypothetical protein ABEB36_003857 [Hypothenemus hampei]|uniref:Uncharacterized protein n=1 Tax=Hypothenemus hampei TaxID=57062 RepID=A0ABD1F1E8_HYPHA
MSLEERLKFGPYLTIYNKDYIPKKIKSQVKYTIEQEFKDPLDESSKTFLEIDKNALIKPPIEMCDNYLEKTKIAKPKIGEMYFKEPVDHIIIKGEQLLNGKSTYQVDYCNIEADIRRKLLESEKKIYRLPDGWEIPLTTQKYDYRPPLVFSEHAMDKPSPIKCPDNLQQNEKMNEILQVKTGNSEYNHVIGKLGEFIVNEKMHGNIVRPDCGCWQHRKLNNET